MTVRTPRAVFRDPVHDGATDPVVIADRANGDWVMFYTQRRASVDEPGVAWVHGSRIGVARSVDGVDWAYEGVVDGLDAGADAGPNTHWAPEVIWDGARYRMYLSFIAGVPDRWEGHARVIREFVSDDLRTWTPAKELRLSSNRVIDACVAPCPDGRWRLWYKDEGRGSTTWVASSADLASWTVEGVVIDGRPHEGVNVFELGGYWWLLVDEWRGMGVYRSPDAVTWTRQGGPDAVILGGVDPEEADRLASDDLTFGRHGDVVVCGDRAVLYYFTHPHWDGSELGSADDAAARLSAVHTAELSVVDGVLVCDREARPVALPAVEVHAV
ncbi:hypothetical protein MN032_08095 [Agromyces atrinae]|uniref:hypothetical protein n=1 Tax=Agromyces atrinae TaxID=592376 RepID=UPI001F59194C|nr:hypothetical protein [Agromyces atrinae]MCI2957650.1 hypothetical protein [Agromyces atrinae]